MKKYLLPSALILVGFLGFALAQNITKSVQMSQFPNGPIGVDAANNVYFPAHILNLGGTPSITYGAGIATVAGNDFNGTITGAETSTTTATLTFRSAYAAAPYCVVASQSGTTPVSYNTVATGLFITSTMGVTKASYICSGAS